MSVGSEKDTVSDGDVSKLFNEVGLGNECSVSYVSTSNASEYHIIGVLRDYDIKTRKCTIATDSAPCVVLDMNFITSFSKLSSHEKVLRKRERRRERLTRLQGVSYYLRKKLSPFEGADDFDMEEFKEFDMLSVYDLDVLQKGIDEVLYRLEKSEVEFMESGRSEIDKEEELSLIRLADG